MTYDETLNFLQNKTIKTVTTDPDANDPNLVILLSDGSMFYIYSNQPFFIGVARNIIN